MRGHGSKRGNAAEPDRRVLQSAFDFAKKKGRLGDQPSRPPNADYADRAVSFLVSSTPDSLSPNKHLPKRPERSPGIELPSERASGYWPRSDRLLIPRRKQMSRRRLPQ